jgi:hypothetical protein
MKLTTRRFRWAPAAVLSLAFAFAFAQPARAADDAHYWLVRYMVVNGDSDATLVNATNELAFHGYLRTPEMHAILAELLAQIVDGKIDAPETAVDCMRILKAAPDAIRYHALFKSANKIRARGSKEIQSSYLSKFPRAKGEQWKRGQVDLAALRRQAMDDALAMKPTAAQIEAFKNLPATSSLDDLFAAVGKPAHVRPRDTRNAQSSGVDLRYMLVYYRGVGRMSVEYRHDGGWRVISQLLDPLAFEGLMPYVKDAAARGLPDETGVALTQMLNGSAVAIRTSAIDMHRRESAPREYLDAAAELLLRQHASASDPTLIDAYAWLCNVLVQHGGTRYATVLGIVQREARDPKLRKFAAQTPRKQPQQAPDYVPGAVPLEELARRYPSPYATGS